MRATAEPKLPAPGTAARTAPARAGAGAGAGAGATRVAMVNVSSAAAGGSVYARGGLGPYAQWKLNSVEAFTPAPGGGTAGVFPGEHTSDNP